MVQEYKWLAIKLCIFLMVHFQLAEAALLTVSPVGDACPGEGITFTCRKNDGGNILHVRWTLKRGTTNLRQLTLARNGCLTEYRHYNSLPIIVTLGDSYSTLNVTADNQLHGIVVEYLILHSPKATVPIRITRKLYTIIQLSAQQLCR